MLLFAVFVAVCWDLAWVSACPTGCECRWKDGKSRVQCANRNLSSIPEGIDTATQVLDLSGNNMQILQQELFLRAGLLNLQRIHLSNCRINQISESAFARLTNLMVLELSNNLLQTVPSHTFKDYPELRRLVLSKNPISRIESHAFVNLPKLTTLEMSQCQLQVVAPKAFDGLESLNHLKLNGNRLVVLRAGTIAGLQNLHSVELQNNPWRCDCSLRDMRTWLLKNRAPYIEPPLCELPARLKGLPIHQLDPDVLACEPRGESHRFVEAYIGDDAVLPCRVTAIPEATVRWYHQGRPLTNMSVLGVDAVQQSSFVLIKENGTTDKLSSLIIPAVSEDDMGSYLCVGENRAGRTETNVTLQVMGQDIEEAGLSGGQIAGLTLGLLLLCGILIAVFVLLLRWRQEQEQVNIKQAHVDSVKAKHLNSVNHVEFTVDSMGNSKLIKKPLLARCNPVNGRDVTPYARNFLENSIGGSCVMAASGLGNKPDVVNVEECLGLSREGCQVDPGRNKIESGGSKQNSNKMWDSNHAARNCNDDKSDPPSPVDLENIDENDGSDSDRTSVEEIRAHEAVVRFEHDRRTENRGQPRRALLKTSTSSDWGGSTQGLLAGSPQSSLDESSSSSSSRPNRPPSAASMRGGLAGEVLERRIGDGMMTLGAGGRHPNADFGYATIGHPGSVNARFRNSVPVLPPFAPAQHGAKGHGFRKNLDNKTEL